MESLNRVGIKMFNWNFFSTKRNYSAKNLVDWLQQNEGSIFTSGFVRIFNEYIEWTSNDGKQSKRISWRKVKHIDIVREFDGNKIKIEGENGDVIKFYINNRNKLRNKYYNYLTELIKVKNEEYVGNGTTIDSDKV